MTTGQLKPCPFCGGKAERYGDIIACEDCNAKVFADQWNDRYNPQPVQKPEFPTWEDMYSAYERKEIEADTGYDFYMWIKEWYEALPTWNEPNSIFDEEQK